MSANLFGLVLLYRNAVRVRPGVLNGRTVSPFPAAGDKSAVLLVIETNPTGFARPFSQLFPSRLRWPCWVVVCRYSYKGYDAS